MSESCRAICVSHVRVVYESRGIADYLSVQHSMSDMDPRTNINTLSFSLSRSFFLSLSLTHTYTHTLSLSPPLSFSFYLHIFLSHTLPPSLPLLLSCSLSLSFAACPTLTAALTHAALLMSLRACAVSGPPRILKCSPDSSVADARCGVQEDVLQVENAFSRVGSRLNVL